MSIANLDVPSLVAEAPDGRDHSAGAHTEHFGDAAALDVLQYFEEVDSFFAHRKACISRQYQDRFARDPVQDGARQRRRAQSLPFVDEGDIHRAHFIDIASFHRIQPQHLLVALRDGVFGRLDTACIVPRRFRFTRPATHRAHIVMRNMDRDRREAAREIRRHRTQDDEMQKLAWRANGEILFGRQHHRPNIERGLWLTRHPTSFQPDQFGNRFKMRCDRDLWHAHAGG